MGFLTSIGSILTGGAAVYGALKGEGGEGKEILKGQEQRLAYVDEIAKAIQDPTHPWYQALVNQERQDSYNQFLMALQQHDVQRQRAIARGQLPSFTTSTDPSIRDAFREKQLAVYRSHPLLQQEARTRARETLQNAAAATGIGLQTAPSSATVAQNIGQSERDVLAAAAEGAGSVFGGLDSIFAPQPSAPTTSSAVGRKLPSSRLPGSS